MVGVRSIIMAIPASSPPSLPSLLTDWGQPGALLAVVFGLAGFFWVQMKDLKAELKTDLQASEVRSNQKIDEVKAEPKEIKADIKALLLVQAPRRPPVAQP